MNRLALDYQPDTSPLDIKYNCDNSCEKNCFYRIRSDQRSKFNKQLNDHTYFVLIVTNFSLTQLRIVLSTNFAILSHSRQIEISARAYVTHKSIPQSSVHHMLAYKCHIPFIDLR